MKASRSSVTRADSSARVASASSRAVARPTAPATSCRCGGRAPARRRAGAARPAAGRARPGTPGALWRTELVAGDRDRIDVEVGQRQPARGLDGIDSELHAACRRGVGDRRDVLHRADLVVRVPDAHERGIGAEGAGDGIRRHASSGVDGNLRHLEPVHAPQVVGRLEDRLVLDRRRHEVPSVARRDRDALDGEVVRRGRRPT